MLCPLTSAALGSAILFAYPELGTLAGVQGVIVYALSSALPLLAFAALGPIIRRKCPQGFVLTEWTRQRYGTAAALYLSFMSLVTLFLYMVSELSAVGQVVNLLTGLNGLPFLIVECAITTIYTCKSEHQPRAGACLRANTSPSRRGVSGLLLHRQHPGSNGHRPHYHCCHHHRRRDQDRHEPDRVVRAHQGQPYRLAAYLHPPSRHPDQRFLPGAFPIPRIPCRSNPLEYRARPTDAPCPGQSHFWLRTFASKTDKDLWLGISGAVVGIFIIVTLVGSTGFIAAWAGVWPGPPEAPIDGSVAFFALLKQLPNWVVGIVLVMSITLSTAAFDSLQTAMVTSASNDLFRNRLSIWWIRAGVVLIMIPVVVIAIRAPSILQIYLISDLVSAATIPVLVIGLADVFYWWRGFEVVVGGLGGLFTVFLFGTVYYGDARLGAELMLLQQGLFTGDWGCFGAFVAAPVGGLLWGFGALALRLTIQYIRARVKGERFDALDRPAYLGGQEPVDPEVGNETETSSDTPGISKSTGKFF